MKTVSESISILILLTITTTPVFAQLVENLEEKIAVIRAVDTICQSEAVTTSDAIQCSDPTLSAADLLLKEIYNARIEDLKNKFAVMQNEVSDSNSAAEVLRRLVAAQSSWILFRDADCLLVGASQLNGKEEDRLILGCKVEKTLKRVIELDQQ